MRRALDVARTKLAQLNERDEIVDCFFEHGSSIFHYTVLLVVKGDTAHGKRVQGLEAPDSLVARMSIPLDQAGVLHRVRDLRKPTVGIATLTDADEQMFGTLGRVMPHALVCPLVVRDRVVAFFIGDAVAEPLHHRAAEAGRQPIDLAKEEMLVWSQQVGEALEQLIMRRKGGSVPPPSFGSTPPPPLQLPPPPRTPSLEPEPLPRAASLVSQRPPMLTSSMAPPSRPRRRWIAFVLVTSAVVAAGGVFFVRARANRDEGDRVVVRGSDLPGFPSAINPTATIDLARAAAGMGDRAELAAVRAEIGKSGLVDLKPPAKSETGAPLAYTFVTDDHEVEVRVERDGIHAPPIQQRRSCGDKPCSLPLPAPKCSFAQIWDAAVGTTGDNERATVIYRERDDGTAGPVWLLELAGRGRARLAADSCKLLPRERLRPLAIPASAVPGAPTAVDPIAAIPIMRTQSGLDDDAVLVELEARDVVARGLVDLDVGDAAVVLTFSDPASIPSKSRRWRQVELRKTGVTVTADETRAPLATNLDLALAAPQCSFVNAHHYMLLDKTPIPSPVARITYGGDVGDHSGRWTMQIRSGDVRKVVSDLECQAWADLKR